MTTPRRSALAAGCLAHAVQDGLSATTYVLLPILAQAFGLSYAQVGLLKVLKSLTQGGLELYSGVLSERIGEARVLVAGLLLSASGYLLFAAATGLGMVMVSLLVIGAGTAFQHSPSSALIGRAYGNDGRRSALGLYNSSGDIGKLGFSACFSLAIGAGIAWQQVSFAMGLGTLAAGGVIALAISRLDAISRGDARVRARGESAENPGTPGQVAQGQLVRDSAVRDSAVRDWGILNRRSFLTLLLIVFLDNVTQAGILVFMAFVVLEKGVPLEYATMAAVAVLAGGVFGKAGCGYLAERLGVKPAFILVQVLTAIGLFGVLAAPGWTAFLLLAPLGVVAQGSTSITYGLVVDMVHPRRLARGYAIMYGSTSIAAAIGPWLFGVAGDHYGISSALVAMAVIALLAIPPMAMLPGFAKSSLPDIQRAS